MKVFAVSDLHLPGRQNKPMDVFGGNWTGHIDKIKEDWKSKVGENDVVLIAGDLSWAMSMEDGLSDLRTLVGLPGKKFLSKATTITGGRASPRCVAPLRTTVFSFCRTTA